MSIVLVGSTSGSITLQEPAVAGTTVLTLPATSGTILTTASSGQSIPKAALPTGSVLQVVNVSYSTRTSYSNPGGWSATGLTATITPQFATSKILILATQHMYQSVTNSQNNVGMGLQVVRNSTTIWATAGNYGAIYNYISVDSASGAREQAIVPTITLLDSPATTSATTYLINGIMGNTGTLVFQDDSKISTMTLMEIAA